mmetsp:Transcript_1118/g.2857  ORF Transcript_1118/g.2857 Transcript_1118/m.2857 type:complete len:219 (-) Transcript_1118:201-857(-)|eukprot:CAMPEP_0172360506 /NCGR_PEP_ID=MMETSP1060-20121228/4512_1 /TAXON_ID=37318 /ORGANISM="Pseudo-nitzschia pungens, Strain cf. cingulata" /LENGTH=218 /DNA_ID=CAMNT_0013082515 /DNA_START=352 /DNA_END=1008 /DNA_ORIENTATION=+
MMIYEQSMLTSNIIPIPHTVSHSTPSSGKKDQQSRSVMFSSSTKEMSSSSTGRKSFMQRKRRSSRSVPIPDAMFRSPSELQLSMDEQMADERDFVFYARLISGIRERTNRANTNGNQQYNDQLHKQYNEETQRCLTHIMQTRYQEQKGEQNGVPIHTTDYLTSATNGEDYYLDDLDYYMSSCSSSSSTSSSSYQQDFEQSEDDDTHCGENECIFDLEL